jgi:hypothetical protein
MFMPGKLAVKEEGEKQIAKLLDESYNEKLYPKGNVWIIPDELRRKITRDALDFFKKLDKVEPNSEGRTYLSLKLSLENNKCTVDTLTSISPMNYKPGSRLMKEAREITGVTKPKPEEYVDSLVSMFVKHPSIKLDENKAKEIARIAKETLTKCEESKVKIPPDNATYIATAAIWHASFKAGSPLDGRRIRDYTNNELVLYAVTNKLVQAARPEEFFEWRERHKPVELNAKFGPWELAQVGPMQWSARIKKDEKNGTATDLDITINRHDGRIEFWQGNKYESISGETTGTAARLFFTQKAKLDEIAHVDTGMKLPKVSVLEEQMHDFLENGGVQKALSEVNKEIEKRERIKEFNRQAESKSAINDAGEFHDWEEGEGTGV